MVVMCKHIKALKLLLSFVAIKDIPCCFSNACTLILITYALITARLSSYMYKSMMYCTHSVFIFFCSFLCVRKEKRHAHSSSAIQDSLDPTQGSSPAELLGLCSGQFEETRDPPSPRRQLPSDSSNTQDVRELLGLATKPKAVGISGLLSGDRGDVEGVTGGLTFDGTQGFSQFNEVVGLCSGAFPTTQATGHVSRPLQSVLGGDESQNAVLNWATKQKEGDGYYGDSESEDEDMPLIKKKRVKLKVKNNNRCVHIIIL